MQKPVTPVHANNVHGARQVQRAVAARRKASYGRISVKSRAEALVATGAALPQVRSPQGCAHLSSLARCFTCGAKPQC